MCTHQHHCIGNLSDDNLGNGDSLVSLQYVLAILLETVLGFCARQPVVRVAGQLAQDRIIRNAVRGLGQHLLSLLAIVVCLILLLRMHIVCMD